MGGRSLACQLILGVTLVSVVAAPRLVMGQTCTNRVYGNINVGDGSTPLDPNGAVVDWRAGFGSCTFGCPPRNFGYTFVELPYGGTYEFAGSAAEYLQTPWQPGATCGSVPGCTQQCSGSFNLTLYADLGNFIGFVNRFPSGAPVAGLRVVSSRTLVGGATTDSTGFYNWATWGGPQYLQNNWGIGVSGDGSGPGFGTYELSAVAYDPGQPFGTVVATTQSSKATEVDFSLWDNGFEQPTWCGPPSSNSGPGTGEASASSSNTPEAEQPTCPACSVGRPVSVTTGAVYLDQTDMKLPGEGPGLRFVRSYNSHLRASSQYGIFGPGWNHVYEQRIIVFPSTPNILMLRKADGNPAYFQDNDGDSTFEPSVPFTKASSIVKLAGPPIRYVRSFRAGGSETYDATGDGTTWRLTRLVDPSGNATDLTWDASGRLTTITDAGSGRALTLNYTGTQTKPDSLSGPLGIITTYSYDPTSGLLKTVTYADGSGYTFDYYNPSNELWKVTDLSGRILETHTYDGTGRASTTEISEGQERYTFDYSQPKRTIVTDARSNVTTYDYAMIWGTIVVTKVAGPCTSCGGGGQTQQSWTYDVKGRILTYTDGAANTTTYTYDPATGDLLTKTTPAPVSGRTTYTYYADGRIQTTTDPLGGVTSYTYGPAGPLTITESVTATQNRTTTLTYTPQGKLSTIQRPRNPSNKVTTLDYYPTGDLKTVTVPLSNPNGPPLNQVIWTYGYDGLGRRTSVKDALLNETTTTYGDGVHVTRITSPDLTHTDFTYDRGGRRTSATDPLGHVTQYDYDAYGRFQTLTTKPSATDPPSSVTTYGYDAMSNVTTITDARAKITTFTYDGFNRVATVTYPATPGHPGPVETMNYDGAGRLATRTDRKGVVTTYGYDTLGRLTGKTYSDGTTPVMFSYDAVGHLLSAANGIDSLTWSYDLAGQMLSEGSTKNASTVAYTYDLDGNRVSLTLNGSAFLGYGYDDSDRLTILTNSNGIRFVSKYYFGYDVASRRTSLTFPRGPNVAPTVSTGYAYDTLSRLTQVLTVSASNTVPPNYTVITQADYTYDSAGNRRSKRTPDYGEAYTYDSLNRLTAVTRGGSTTENYTYDAVGNRLSSLTVPFWSYDDRNELTGNSTTSFTYDLNGNIIGKVDRDTGTWTYEWTAENQLKRVLQGGFEVARFSYDPLGRRVEKVVGSTSTTYTYDREDIVRQVRGSSVVSYVHGPGIDEPLAVAGYPGSPYYVDGLGSIVKGAAGTRQYDAFGNLQIGASTGGYAFTGREWDPETGLHYYRARYYDPKLGRFVSEDPIGLAGGDVNFYAYVFNSPVNWTDPFGLDVQVCQRPMEGMPNYPHTYLNSTKGGVAWGLGPRGNWMYVTPWTRVPGHIKFEDPNAPKNTCNTVKGDDCVERCLLRKLVQQTTSGGPPKYNLGKYQCNDYVDDMLRQCRQECGQ